MVIYSKAGGDRGGAVLAQGALGGVGVIYSKAGGDRGGADLAQGALGGVGRHLQ